MRCQVRSRFRFFVMSGLILAARLAGAFGLESMDSWSAPTRVGFAAMFVFTRVAHFNRMRGDLIRRVPPSLPHPGALVPVTGTAELAGAVGLLVPLSHAGRRSGWQFFWWQCFQPISTRRVAG